MIKVKLSANCKSSSNFVRISSSLLMFRMSNVVSNTFVLCPVRRGFMGFDVVFLILALVDYRKLTKDSKLSQKKGL